MKAMKKVLVSALAAALVVTAAAPCRCSYISSNSPKAVNGKATVKGVTVKTSKKGTATVTAVKSKRLQLRLQQLSRLRV